MPLYTYECPQCGFKDTEFQLMSEANLTHCPACKKGTYKRIPSLPHSMQKAYRKPIEMTSIAMESVNDIREFKKKCPDVEISDDPRHPQFGIPIAESRQAKTQALKAAGFSEMN